MASVLQPLGCPADGPKRGEQRSERNALAKVGQSIFSRGRPTTVTFDDNADPKVDKALHDLFKALTSKDRLDIERFIAAQAALARALGDVSDKLAATSAFLALTGEHATLKNFSCWQRGLLQSRGMSTAEMAEVIGHVTEDAKRAFRKQLGASWLPRNLTHNGQSHPNQCDKPSHSQKSKQLSHEDKPISLPTTGLPSIAEGSSSITQALLNSEDGKQEADADKDCKTYPRVEIKEISRKKRAGGNKENSSTKLRQPVQHHVKHTKQKADSLPKQVTKIPQGENAGSSVESRANRLDHLTHHGRETPDIHATSVSKLAKYLIKNASSDEEKAWVIFSWVCHHIDYDVDGLHGRAVRQSSEPEDVLASRLSVCAGYAGIFQALATGAGLTVQQVSGHARNCSRRVGQDVIADGVGAHAWNAVKLGDDWILIDCTWGAGTCTSAAFNRDFRPHFFAVPPNQLAFTHFPNDPSWQLLRQPTSYSHFIKQPIVSTDVFFGHSLSFIPFSAAGTIKLADSSEGSLKLDVPADVFLMAKLAGKDCNREASGTCVTIRFKLSGGSETEDLEIYARRGGPYGSYALACRFVVESF